MRSRHTLAYRIASGESFVSVYPLASWSTAALPPHFLGCRLLFCPKIVLERSPPIQSSGGGGPLGPRKQAELSLEALAHEAGIDRTHVSQVERRKPNMTITVLVTGALIVLPRVLLMRGVPQTSPSRPNFWRQDTLVGSPNSTGLRILRSPGAQTRKAPLVVALVSTSLGLRHGRLARELRGRGRQTAATPG
jgi:hypothetical protein